MTRAMTLIKMYFVGYLRALTAGVSRHILEKVSSLCWSWETMSCSLAFIQDASQSAQMHLLYTRLQSVSAPLSSPLLRKLERGTCLLPRYIHNLLMFTPVLTLRTSVITSMMTSAPESWTNSVSQCSAKSVQSFQGSKHDLLGKSARAQQTEIEYSVGLGWSPVRGAGGI